jgi:hypothetical protein
MQLLTLEVDSAFYPLGSCAPENDACSYVTVVIHNVLCIVVT